MKVLEVLEVLRDEAELDETRPSPPRGLDVFRWAWVPFCFSWPFVSVICVVQMDVLVVASCLPVSCCSSCLLIIVVMLFVFLMIFQIGTKAQQHKHQLRWRQSIVWVYAQLAALEDRSKIKGAKTCVQLLLLIGLFVCFFCLVFVLFCCSLLCWLDFVIVFFWCVFFALLFEVFIGALRVLKILTFPGPLQPVSSEKKTPKGTRATLFTRSTGTVMDIGTFCM